MNLRENKQQCKQNSVVQNTEQSAERFQQKLAMAETMLDQVDAAQLQIQDLQNDISLLQTAENALDLISENLAKIRRLTLDKKHQSLTDKQMMELNHQIRDLMMVNTLVAEGTEFNGHHLFKDDIIHMNSTGSMDLCLVTAKLPEVNGLDNNDVQSTMDSLELAARIINRQYARITKVMQSLMTYYQQLQSELSLLMTAQTTFKQPLD